MPLTRLLVAAAVGVLLGVLVAQQLRHLFLAVLLLPHFFPGEIPRPLRLSPAPTVATIDVAGPAGRIVADVYRPIGGPHPAMILILGVDPLPRDHPQVTTLLDGIARAGIVAVIAESDALVSGQLRPEETDNLVALFEYFERDPGVDPRRIGFTGLCVGGVLELLAASDPRIADRVSYVNAFSVYYDARDVLAAILSETMPVDGGIAPWSPHATTRSVFLRHLLAGLPAEEAAILQLAALEGGAQGAELQQLSPLGRQMRDLLLARDPSRVQSLLSTLPGDREEWLRRLSPSATLHRLRARTFLMHDEADTLLPVSGARRLAAALPSEARVQYTEFRLFAHVVPEGIDNPLTFVREIAKLIGHVSALLQAVENGR